MSIFRLALTIGVILVYRWTLHLSTPKEDYRTVSIYGYDLLTNLRRRLSMLRVWLIGMVRYLPTKQVEQAWIVLRNQLVEGRYGEAGT